MKFSCFTKPGCLCRGLLPVILAVFLAGLSAPATASGYTIKKATLDKNTYVLAKQGEDSSDVLITVYVDDSPVQSFTTTTEKPSPYPLRVEDYNFDGHMDFSIFSSQGSVQIMYDVFLFHPETQRYVKSRAMSELPCISVAADAKTLSGYCFHASNCANWSETYTVSGFDDLSLVARWGTECCPESENCYYEYSIEYKDGKVISEQWTPRPGP